MDNQPIRDERILEAIEACRPGSDDLADPALAYMAHQLEANPELKRRYERLQRVDARLAAAFRDVPVPEGLARQIIDRLAAARAEQAAATDEEQLAEPPAAEPEKVVPAKPRRASRRWLLAAAGTLSTAGVLLVAALVYINTRDVYDESAVLKDAVEFFSKESPEPGYFLSDRDQPPPPDHPISRGVARVGGMRWRSINGFLGRSGVAYDLPDRDGTTRATLYVVRRTVGGLDTQPPPRPR